MRFKSLVAALMLLASSCMLPAYAETIEIGKSYTVNSIFFANLKDADEVLAAHKKTGLKAAVTLLNKDQADGKCAVFQAEIKIIRVVETIDVPEGSVKLLEVGVGSQAMYTFTNDDVAGAI